MTRLGNQRGIALVVTLLVVALLTALVVEFAYGVYIGTVSLDNWRDSQRLSRMAHSGVTVAARMVSDSLRGKEYSYPGVVEFPVENPFHDFTGTILVRVEDENGKFNLNALVPPNGDIREEDPGSPYNCFKRLLRLLSLDEGIADRIVDWIDDDKEARLPDSEAMARNAILHSRDEILLIRGISREDYEALSPYITAFGRRDNLAININSAEKPVLRSLSDRITEEHAQRIIDYRRNSPFERASDLGKVAGFERDMGIPPGAIVVKGEHFSLRAVTDSGGVKRIVDAVYNVKNSATVYWMEY